MAETGKKPNSKIDSWIAPTGSKLSSAGEGQQARPITSEHEKEMENILKDGRRTRFSHDVRLAKPELKKPKSGQLPAKADIGEIFGAMLKRASFAEREKRRLTAEKIEAIKKQPVQVLSLLEGYLLLQQKVEDDFKEMSRLKKSKADQQDIEKQKAVWQAAKALLEERYHVNQITEEMLDNNVAQDNAISSDNRQMVELVRNLRLGALSQEARQRIRSAIHNEIDFKPETMRLIAIYANNEQRFEKVDNKTDGKYKPADLRELKTRVIKDWLGTHGITEQIAYIGPDSKIYQLAEHELNKKSKIIRKIRQKKLFAAEEKQPN